VKRLITNSNVLDFALFIIYALWRILVTQTKQHIHCIILTSLYIYTVSAHIY